MRLIYFRDTLKNNFCLSFSLGIVGITLSHTNPIPKDPNSPGDVEAAETYNQFSLGWWANPIFGTGDYPDVMKWQIGNKSLEQGYNSSRLPEFTEEEKQMNKGTHCLLQNSAGPNSRLVHFGNAGLKELTNQDTVTQILPLLRDNLEHFYNIKLYICFPALSPFYKRDLL